MVTLAVFRSSESESKGGKGKWISRALYAAKNGLEQKLDFAFRTIVIVDPQHPQGRRTLKVKFLKDEDVRTLQNSPHVHKNDSVFYRVTIVRDEDARVCQRARLYPFVTEAGTRAYEFRIGRRRFGVIDISRIFHAPKKASR